MAKVTDIYAGSYLNASELTPLGQRRHAIVHAATVEMVGQDSNGSRRLSWRSSAQRACPGPRT